MRRDKLARAGYDVTIYDERLAWEKPCGGGLTHKAIVAYPFLLNGPYPKKLVHTVELISSLRTAALSATRSSDRHLLAHGTQRTAARARRGRRLPLVRSRVTRIDTAGTARSPDSRAMTNRSRLRRHRRRRAQRPASRHASPRTRRPGNDPRLFHSGPRATPFASSSCARFEGYHLVVPAHRPSFRRHLRQHGAAHQPRIAPLRSIKFLRDEGHSTEGARFYSHVLPSPQMPTLQRRPIAGNNWAHGGRRRRPGRSDYGRRPLLRVCAPANCWPKRSIAERPAAISRAVRADFSADLEFATRVARDVYRGRFLGGCGHHAHDSVHRPQCHVPQR